MVRLALYLVLATGSPSEWTSSSGGNSTKLRALKLCEALSLAKALMFSRCSLLLCAQSTLYRAVSCTNSKWDPGMVRGQKAVGDAADQQQQQQTDNHV